MFRQIFELMYSVLQKLHCFGKTRQTWWWKVTKKLKSRYLFRKQIITEFMIQWRSESKIRKAIRKQKCAYFISGVRHVLRNGAYSLNRRAGILPNLQLAYISNLKVASTSIKEILYLSEKGLSTLPKNISAHHVFNEYMVEVDREKSFPYFSFYVVRNPFERMVSAYVEKYVGKGKFNYFSLYLFGRFSKDMGFAYFIEKGPSHMSDRWADPHVVSQYLKCYRKDGTCRVDFIGKFETLAEDWKVIQGHAKAPLADLPYRNATEKTDWRDYYTTELAHCVYQRYQKDFELFGYEEEYPKLLAYLAEKGK